MPVPGSYFLLNKATGRSAPDAKVASARVLQLFRSEPLSFPELLALSGWSEATLRAAVDDLRRRELIKDAEGGKLALTDLGLKAQFIVGS